ncbi:hypothetical protein TUSST3_62170 [Streptomyces sp. TUS-ST3]|jgi:hypothetical protein|uniref:hypothetical protein n=1 Tax=Streptomyces sp. TUS-ST3 TaxID=3025591 RepID=UPI00235B391A|nr:hypothetical protein [Streptomyces sp. TUS-ST3]GLP69595.1 hypothetical protein TUSST3_62170 [Streptomyces sp. TUS-ST3]
MHTTKTRFRHGALTAGAAVLALLAVGCSKASAGAQTGGCRDDAEWSGRQQAAWLRSAVAFQGTTDGAGPSYAKASVVLHPPRTGDVRALCRPLAVQVEFWALTARLTGPETSFVMRHELSMDGSNTRTVAFPSGLPTGRDGTCTRVLVAAYAGRPLAGGELPRVTGELATAGDADVRFGTEWIGVHRLLPAQDPAQCDADRSTPNPSPTASTGWDIYHP